MSPKQEIVYRGDTRGLDLSGSPHGAGGIGGLLARTDANEMQFSSMPHDSLSGLSFYPFRAYEPNFQRWLNQDPIQEGGGINLYRFNLNNPLSLLDPFGFAGEGEDIEPNPTENEDNDREFSEKWGLPPPQITLPSDEAFEPVPTPGPPLTPDQFAQEMSKAADEAAGSAEEDEKLLNPDKNPPFRRK